MEGVGVCWVGKQEEVTPSGWNSLCKGMEFILMLYKV